MLNFEDVSVGQSLPDLVIGPLTSAHLMRWSSATENWHKIHYDRPFSVERDKLPDILIQGSLKQQFLFRHLMDWAGETGHVWKVDFQFRAMNLVDETLTVWGEIAELSQAPDFALAVVTLGIRNNAGTDSTPGKATVALPYRAGEPVARPFTPPAA